MNFPSIDIQGSIISSDLLGKIRTEQATFQHGKDFNKELTDAKLKDEISFAWQDAKGQWVIFQNKLSRLKEGETGTTETRNFWIVPLLTNLGYNLSFNRQAEELNGKTFPIVYRDSQLDGFPVYIGGYYESLDKRPDNRQLRVSPHAMVQEYLNYSEHLNGIVTNGKQLRLLRDASRITRLSYIEFNLQKMMEEDLYSDFVLFYRLLHSSRMPQKMDGGSESIIEKYHQEGLQSGSTIRDKLGNAVKDAIKSLANGFINHPDNVALHEALQQGELNVEEYYRQLLRIIYRLLFVFVIEERNLVYAESKAPDTRRFSQIYFNYYSLMRLRKLAKKLPPPDASRHYDLWQGLLNTFVLFEKKEMGAKLGIMCLQGDLFGPDSIASSSYDLHDCRLSNALLLQIIKALSYFETESNVQIAVNYGGLDVEEFGSVYEGLLELKLKIELFPGTNNYSCSYIGSEERSKSGSHYTHDELVQPLIKHSLDYLLEDRSKIISDFIIKQKLIGPSFRNQRQQLVNQYIYSLKVCDVACGSGHLLISGARRIAEAAACIIEEEEQPNPKAFQLAKRNAILSCVYGVDKNPLAVELCKVALWLEAYVPGQPLNFLDHHIKCGDAIVGLAHRKELENGIADEAFKTLPGDDKGIAKIFRDQNIKQRKEREAKAIQLQAEFEKTTENSVQEAMAEYKTFNKLSETTPEEIERKAKAYQKFMNCKGYGFLKIMADTQLAQFFIPKIEANKEYLMTDGDFRQIMEGHKGWQDRKTTKPYEIAINNRFFHWFLEFPEVFQQDGFDCVLGNPPFLGGQKLSGNYGENYLECIKYEFSPIGAVDLVTYFFRRIFSLLKIGGFQSLIATNTIAQGKAREDGLDIIVRNGGTINHAVKSMKWPGEAAVEVALVTITKQTWKGKFILAGKEVNTITPYLDDAETLGNPFNLKQNEGKSFQGCIVLGKGFVLEPDEAKALIAKDQRNKDVLFPYLNGDDLNNNPDQSPSRWVINFKDWPLRRYSNEEWHNKSGLAKEIINEKLIKEQAIEIAPPWYGCSVAQDYPNCLDILEGLVKPERQLMKGDRGAEYWWQFLRTRNELYLNIDKMERVLVVAQVSKTLGFVFVNTQQVISMMCIALIFENYSVFGMLQSTIHKEWVNKYASALKSDIRYTPSDVFETFPFPKYYSSILEQKLEYLGEQYHESRKSIMLTIQMGLTKTYNLFHTKEVQLGITTKSLQSQNKPTIEKDYGKGVCSLWFHIQKIKCACSLEEVLEGIVKLRVQHTQIDYLVLEAYGWTDIQLNHDFYEVEYLPKNDCERYTIHPDARKEILKRLLKLNHKTYDAELSAGLWNTKKTPTQKIKREVNEPQVGYGDFFSQK